MCQPWAFKSNNQTELLNQDMTTQTSNATATKKPEKKRYLVGIVAQGPASNVTLGGVSFPVMTHETREDGTEIQRTGAIVELSVDDLRRIQKAADNRIVRWISGRKKVANGQGGMDWVNFKIRADIYDVNQIGFTPLETDEPLINYLYIDEAPAEVKPIPDSIKTRIARELEVAAKAEREAQADPKDVQVREDHKRAKALGQKVDRDNLQP